MVLIIKLLTIYDKNPTTNLSTQTFSEFHLIILALVKEETKKYPILQNPQLDPHLLISKQSVLDFKANIIRNYKDEVVMESKCIDC